MATAEAAAPTLAVSGLQAWYGESHVLHGVDFEVRPGEVVTLLGRNGAGKTTTLKSIMGIVGKRSGSVVFAGRETIGLSSDRIARLGMAICPEERAIFASLSVRENLMLPPRVARRRADARAHLRALPQSRRAPRQRRRQAVGRRAADAGDRPHPAHRRALPDARRTDRGPGAGHHPPDRRRPSPSSSARVSPFCWSSRTSVSPRRSRTATT